MKDIFHPARIARQYYNSSRFLEGIGQFEEAFEQSPKAWWLAMEWLRCQQQKNLKENSLSNSEIEKIIFFSPNYIDNSYQKNLYSEGSKYGYKVLPIDTIQLNSFNLAHKTCKHIVFHQHWLKELYWRSSSVSNGIQSIDRHISILKAIKAYGAKICWTLHNLIDHDANEVQQVLCNYALKEMAKVSELIFIHTAESGRVLSNYCNKDLSSKFLLLEHPLYDDIFQLTDRLIPREIDTRKIDGCRILLSMGMIRPYKGVPELIQAFQQFTYDQSNHNLHLIIAGHLSDPFVMELLNKLDSSVFERISLVPRILDDKELAGLMQLAHISVTPYRKILISGSFYLATTFGKPTLAPQRGMFEEVIQDGVTGLLYDGTIDGLAKSLFRVHQLSDEELHNLGNRAKKLCEHLSIPLVSSRFFTFLDSI